MMPMVLSLYSTSGYQAVLLLSKMRMEIGITDKRGYLVNMLMKLIKARYFLKNGIQLRDSIREDENGNQYYYDQTGACSQPLLHLLMVKNCVTLMPRALWLEVLSIEMDSNSLMKTAIRLRAWLWVLKITSYLTSDSEMLLSIVLLKVINQVIGTTWSRWSCSDRSSKDWSTNTLVFDQDGKVKGKIVTLSDKSILVTLMPTQRNGGRQVCWIKARTNGYFDKTGKAVTGLQKIMNKHFTLTKMVSKSRVK